MKWTVMRFIFTLLIVASQCWSKNISLTPTLPLNNGLKIPVLGFGCWGINYSRYYSVIGWLLNDHNESARVIIEAIRAGYRHLDSAYIYDIERSIGIALRYVFSYNIVKREELFITTKVWNNFHRRDRVVEGLKLSLKEMGVDYVDLALIHFPTGFDDGDNVYPINFLNLSIIPRMWKRGGYLETWKGMEDAYELGLARAIGVSNFNLDQLRNVVEHANIMPAMNQVESNPYYNQKQMLEFCRKNNIAMTAYSPLRAGKELLQDPTLVEIGRHHRKSAAQVALRWNVQRGAIVVSKTTRRKRMKQNLNLFDFELSDDEMSRVNSLPQKSRVTRIYFVKNHPDYPGDLYRK